MLSYVLELLFSTSPNDDDSSSSLDENLDKYLDFLKASASLTVKMRATAEAMTIAIGMQRIVFIFGGRLCLFAYFLWLFHSVDKSQHERIVGCSTIAHTCNLLLDLARVVYAPQRNAKLT